MLADFLNEYFSIIVFLIIALGLSFLFIIINFALAPKNPILPKEIAQGNRNAISKSAKDQKSQASIQ